MKTFNTSREIPATLDQVFSAISNPEKLSKWWGPAGFSNTFKICQFKNGGRWSLIMHGPDDSNYPNENVFLEIDPPKKVIIEHINEPKFRLTITLTSSLSGTTVFWSQAFESSEVASRIEHIVVPANDQNLERLSIEVLNNLS
ncbi:MAG: SRPBCC domain-containing protein [Pseudobdellovibrionaceae bacterium]